MESPIFPPPNSTLVLRRDHRWPTAFALLALLAMILAASFALVGWPRLESMSRRYAISRLHAQVESLRREERALAVELDSWRSPSTLSVKAKALGLVPPDASDVRSKP